MIKTKKIIAFFLLVSTVLTLDAAPLLTFAATENEEIETEVIDCFFAVQGTAVGDYYTRYYVTSPDQPYYEVAYHVVEHDYSVGKEIKPATCSEQGIEEVFCSNCGSSYQKEIPALGHDFSTDWTIDKEPTCTEPGSKSHHCSRCDEVADITEIPMIEHSWDEGIVTVEPTCTTEGVKTFTCTACSATKTEPVDALGHDFSDWEVDKEPTCLETGVASYHCTRCGERTEITELPLGSHFWHTEIGKIDWNNPTTVTETSTCLVCGETKTGTVEIEVEYEVNRAAGPTRYQTSLAIADKLKEVLGVGQFEAVVISTGVNFPDALAGGYLANVNNAPILLISEKTKGDVVSYVKKNVKPGSRVFVLGGTNVVPNSWLSGIRTADYEIKRLCGINRYLTNIEILKELKVSAGSEILVATGNNYADALSASAVSMPILLVNKTLSKDQITYLNSLRGSTFHILGGTPEVSADIEKALKDYGKVDRTSGSTRYATSVAIAEKFIESPDAAAMAYGQNFPDGLCGGVLANKMNAPLLLVDNPEKRYSAASDYCSGKSIKHGLVFGSAALIADKTAVNIVPPDSYTIIMPTCGNAF